MVHVFGCAVGVQGYHVADVYGRVGVVDEVIGVLAEVLHAIHQLSVRFFFPLSLEGVAARALGMYGFGLTFLRCLLNFWPGILTLTVLVILPALTTTPTVRLKGVDTLSASVLSTAVVGSMLRIEISEGAVGAAAGVMVLLTSAGGNVGMLGGEADEISVAKHRALLQACIAGRGHMIARRGLRKRFRLMVDLICINCLGRMSVSKRGSSTFDAQTCQDSDSRLIAKGRHPV